MNERRRMILTMVTQQGEVHFSQLKECFPDVSEATLRKDLKYLDATKQLVRIHGGAKSFPQVMDFDLRSALCSEEKVQIATKAAALIHPRDSVFISAGSTCVELSKRISYSSLSVFTDGLNTVMNFNRSSGSSLELLGGEVDFNTMRMNGPSVLEALDRLHFNIAFLGTPGLNLKYGFADMYSITSAIVAIIISRSDRVAILMDSSKVNNAQAPRYTPLKDIDIVVSDGALPEEAKQRLEEAGIQIL